MSDRCRIKAEKSFDQRVKDAILEEEKKWPRDESYEASPKLKLVITFEGINSKMKVVEDRHEFTWRPKPSNASEWMNLEQKIVMADISQSVDSGVAIDDVLAKSLPKPPWTYHRCAFETLGLFESEIDLVSRAWIEVIPGTLNLVIIDRTLAINPCSFMWELNTETCARRERGTKCKFLEVHDSPSSKDKFEHLEKTFLKMSHDECLALGAEARKDKHWEKANAEYQQWNDDFGVHAKEFFVTSLASAFKEDSKALEACHDARAVESYSRDSSF